MSKVLVIDDDLDFTRMLKIRLSQSGFEISVANDAYKGVELAHKDNPDIILMDLKMPAGGGLSTLRHVKMSSQTSHIPIIVLTGVRDEAQKTAALSEGIAAYVEKPYDSDKLVEIINKTLSKE